MNKNVALCYNNISIEGIAEEIGYWNEKKSKKLEFDDEPSTHI